jgi:hypothetical protein
MGGKQRQLALTLAGLEAGKAESEEAAAENR